MHQLLVNGGRGFESRSTNASKKWKGEENGNSGKQTESKTHYCADVLMLAQLLILCKTHAILPTKRTIGNVHRLI